MALAVKQSDASDEVRAAYLGGSENGKGRGITPIQTHKVFRATRRKSGSALNSLDEIIDEFDQSKKERNDIVHGDPIDEAGLPTAKDQNWRRELIRLHVARSPFPDFMPSSV
jgi:hypothetical protein